MISMQMQAEIKGKDMTLILPPAFAEQHAQSIKNFVMSGAFTVADRLASTVTAAEICILRGG